MAAWSSSRRLVHPSSTWSYFWTWPWLRRRRSRAGPPRDGGGRPVRVEGEGGGVDVGEHGAGAHLQDRRRRRDEGERRGHDLVARSDPERDQNEPQGVRARPHADGVLDVEGGP